MAQIFVSPGVYSKEIDQSFMPPAAGGAIGAALIGLTKKGPAYKPTRVSNFGEFRQVFGDLDPDKYLPYAARAYLRHANTLTVSRVMGRGTVATGAIVPLAFPTADTASAISSSLTTLGLLKFRGSATDVQLSGSPSNFAIVVGSVTATGLSLVESSNAYIKKVLGTDPTEVKAGDSCTALYVDSVFDWNVGSITGSLSGATANATFVTPVTADYSNITGGFKEAETPTIISQNYGGVFHDLMTFKTIAHGPDQNTEVKISISQVENSSTGASKFTVSVREFGDTDTEPVILETFANVTLDRSSKQFIGRVIGDRKTTYDLTQSPPEMLFDGDYDNQSKYIRVEVYDGYPLDARPSGFKGIGKIGTTAPIPDMPTKTDELDARSSVNSNVFMGIDFTQGGVRDALKKTVTSASGTSSANTGIAFFSTTAELSGSALDSTYTHVNMVGSNSATNFSTTNALRFTVPLYEGWDGFDPRSDLRVDQNDGTLSADFIKSINILSNPDEYDFNLIAVPGVQSSSVGSIPARVIDMVTERGDAFYLLDISNGTTTGAGLAMTVAQAKTEAEKYDSNYAATYYPWIRINDTDNDKIVWVPPSCEVISAYSFNDRVAQPWWAPAGFNRGGIENVLEVRRRLTQGQRDDLSVSNANPIATFPGQGIVVWGQDTLQKKESLLSKVNVRRMLLEVRKTIAGFSRLFVFEPNSPTTRSRLQQIINNYLQTVQAANGLVEFRAILDDTTTTPELIDRNTIKGQIFLKPTTAAEIILLDFSVTRTGAIFSE